MAPRVGSQGHEAATATTRPDRSSIDEDEVARFFMSLDDEQRRLLCFPFDHPKRARVENNWAITSPTIGDLSGGQQALCREIFRNTCSDEGYERFQGLMDDDGGGFGRYHVALFGEPRAGSPCEWVLTGRHLTLRADGSRGGAGACGGPIFYGHATERASNVWWYQGRQANTIFSTLDETERKRALIDASNPGALHAHRRIGDDHGEAGIAVGSLDPRQKTMVRQLLRDLTRPFRSFEVEEIRGCLRDGEGVDGLRLTFFRDGEGGDDRGQDIWKLEGETFTWYYHGSPHVHSWVTVA